MPEKITKFSTPLAILIAGLIIAGAYVYINRGETENLISEQGLSAQAVAEKAIDYINENILAGASTASLVEAIEENGLYKVKIRIEDQEFDSYISPNGELLFVEGIDMTEIREAVQGETTPQDIPKSDVPDIKVFVMSYCPYGLQAQKMFLPVYDLLKEKAEMGIYFVDYIMHDKQEIDENLRQYCIQKQEEAKYSDYLSCFVVDGDFEKCLSQTNINEANLAICISETDEEYKITEQYNDKSTWLNGSYPKFDVQADLNEIYGVGGSPTVVINDTVANISPRSPENFKQVVCQAFNSTPEECSQILSNEAPSPGLGGGTTSSSGGTCE